MPESINVRKMKIQCESCVNVKDFFAIAQALCLHFVVRFEADLIHQKVKASFALGEIVRDKCVIWSPESRVQHVDVNAIGGNVVRYLLLFTSRTSSSLPPNLLLLLPPSSAS